MGEKFSNSVKASIRAGRSPVCRGEIFFAPTNRVGLLSGSAKASVPHCHDGPSAFAETASADKPGRVRR